MALTKSRVRWRSVLLEAGLVVLGVVLALAANEWRKAHLDRQGAALALQSIREELQVNRAAVLASEHYHAELADSLMAVARRAPSGNPSAPARPDRRLFARGFFYPATLLHTAWDAAAATDAVRHMDYQDVLRVSQIYEEQERYRRQSEQVGQLLYAQLFSHGFDGVLQNYVNLSTILAAVWYRECQLLKRYDQVLDELGGASPADVAPVPERCARVP